MNTAGLLKGFGSVVERYRHERALSVETLAIAAGVPEALIKSYEAGDYGPTFADFLRIANGLDVPPCTLLNDVLVQWRLNPSDY
jgi:transcriptional regulator with XRE-family HTH domain